MPESISTNLQGLTSQEAAERLVTDGFNDLEAKQERTLLRITYDVIRDPMFLLLFGAGFIYLLMGDMHEAMILLGFIFIIIFVTVFQEKRTEKVLEALRGLSSPRALVIRDGVSIRIAGKDVVRDDIVILSEGDRVPADGVILSSHELSVDESMLTGESIAISKHPESDSDNLLFAGTLLVSGQCVMKVTAIGSSTEIGKIGKSLQTIEIESSPLQKQTSALASRLAIIGIWLCVFVASIFFLSRGGFFDSILAGITLAMGILPQEFPVIMIIFMAFGARRIAAHKVLTRRLSAIETLGQTTVLCVDKTGTLTQNKMSVVSLYIFGESVDISDSTVLPEEFHELVEYSLLASEIDPHDPMEKAFHALAIKHLADTEHIHPNWNLTKEYELTPELMAMSHMWYKPDQDSCAIASKGAPEAIIDLCHLNEDKSKAILEQVALMADKGLRVLGVARALHDTGTPPQIQHEFVYEFLGLLGLSDPLREDVPDAVRVCHEAGIRVVMITGDYPRTAAAIAEQAGIDSKTVLTGTDIQKINQEELTQIVGSSCVFARVSPSQKLMIVEALKVNGEIVAMTGDGVNDAPALKSAHIGIAMGKRGTDVAREASSIVLLEDSFGAIVQTIKQGRRIFANLRKAMIYTLAVHMPIIGLSFLPILFGLPLVLAPVHIAFLELVIDPACSVVFEAQEPEETIMRSKPRSIDEPLISRSHIFLSVIQGLSVSTALFIFYWFILRYGVVQDKAKTMLFIALVVSNLILIFSSKSIAILSPKQFVQSVNKIDLIVIFTTLFALLLITNIEFFSSIFMFTSLSVPEWLCAFCIGFCTIIIFEGVKALFNRC